MQNSDELDKKISEQKWTFAKTYAKTAPHEYFVKHQNPELFALLQARINEEGVNEVFALFKSRKTYRYFYHGAYRYWIDEPVMNRVQVVLIEKKDGVCIQKFITDSQTTPPRGVADARGMDGERR